MLRYSKVLPSLRVQLMCGALPHGSATPPNRKSQGRAPAEMLVACTALLTAVAGRSWLKPAQVHVDVAVGWHFYTYQYSASEV